MTPKSELARQCLAQPHPTEHCWWFHPPVSDLSRHGLEWCQWKRQSCKTWFGNGASALFSWLRPKLLIHPGVIYYRDSLRVATQWRVAESPTPMAGLDLFQSYPSSTRIVLQEVHGGVHWHSCRRLNVEIRWRDSNGASFYIQYEICAVYSSSELITHNTILVQNSGPIFI